MDATDNEPDSDKVRLRNTAYVSVVATGCIVYDWGLRGRYENIRLIGLLTLNGAKWYVTFPVRDVDGTEWTSCKRPPRINRKSSVQSPRRIHLEISCKRYRRGTLKPARFPRRIERP